MPDFTVVVPTRDRRPLLVQALASARAQRSVDLEIVVVDDGSADGTAGLVRSSGFPLSAARHYLAAIAAGDRRARLLLPTVALPFSVREAVRRRGADHRWTSEAEVWPSELRASGAGPRLAGRSTQG